MAIIIDCAVLGLWLSLRRPAQYSIILKMNRHLWQPETRSLIEWEAFVRHLFFRLKWSKILQGFCFQIQVGVKRVLLFICLKT